MASQPIAALRDATFYQCPGGFGPNPKPPKYHVIVLRPRDDVLGPACGYRFHNEETETLAKTIRVNQRCRRPGCRAQWARLDKEPRHD
jgi:hypothetical protein